MRSLKWILLLMLQISKQLNYMGKTCPPTTILYNHHKGNLISVKMTILE